MLITLVLFFAIGGLFRLIMDYVLMPNAPKRTRILAAMGMTFVVWAGYWVPRGVI